MSSSTSSRRKFHVRQPAAVVDIGCNCGAPKLITSLFSSLSSSRNKSKHKSSNNPAFSNTTTTTSYSYSNAAYTTSSWDPSFSSFEDMRTPLSPLPPPPPPPRPQQTDRASRRRKKKTAAAAADAAAAGRVARESVAVVKETAEPYSEFKESMMQMIVEKEIYGWDDLNDLLNRFLSLNSPRHHHVIVRAFADIWNGVFSPPSPLAASAAPPATGDYYPTTSPSTYYYY